MNLRDQLSLHEGRKKYPYEDTVGKLTIGVGHNLTDNGLSDAVIDIVLEEDIAIAESELDRVLEVWRELGKVRQQVMVDMMFNLGAPGLMTFNRFRRALMLKDYDQASIEMLDSKWATQVGMRAARLAEMMRTGKHPDA